MKITRFDLYYYLGPYFLGRLVLALIVAGLWGAAAFIGAALFRHGETPQVVFIGGLLVVICLAFLVSLSRDD